MKLPELPPSVACSALSGKLYDEDQMLALRESTADAIIDELYRLAPAFGDTGHNLKVVLHREIDDALGRKV